MLFSVLRAPVSVRRLEFGHSRAAKRQQNFSLARKRQVNCYRVLKPGTGGRYPSPLCRPSRAYALG
jgi:hypothetical protein